ncbi:hypothetical protein GCM10027598_40860 [Amycolatopsis oliviviridis]|uniref:Uncharacterized protein n=1 Tax=Amycolatopsis oliviviridis TaxID=1471590 RepID=A0ABQ3LBE6_9PSEU|nr:hypothetical protein GCM10017790_20980 [Amycolatopsis oliviviridis]
MDDGGGGGGGGGTGSDDGGGEVARVQAASGTRTAIPRSARRVTAGPGVVIVIPPPDHFEHSNFSTPAGSAKRPRTAPRSDTGVCLPPLDRATNLVTDG